MIMTVMFSNIIILCLVFLQTYTFLLLSFSTVICYSMIFVIILNSQKLLKICCGVNQKAKIIKQKQKHQQGVGKQMTYKITNISVSQQALDFSYTVSHMPIFSPYPPSCFLPKYWVGSNIIYFPVTLSRLFPKVH